MATADFALEAALQWQMPDAWRAMPWPDPVSLGPQSEPSELHSISSCVSQSDDLSACTLASESTDWGLSLVEYSSNEENPHGHVTADNETSRTHQERERVRGQTRVIDRQRLRLLDFDARARPMPQQYNMTGNFCMPSQRRRRSVSPRSLRNSPGFRMPLSSPALSEGHAHVSVQSAALIDASPEATTREAARDQRLAENLSHSHVGVLGIGANLEGIREMDQNPAVNTTVLTTICSQYNSMRCRGAVGAMLDSHAVGFDNVPGSSIYWTSRPVTASFNRRSTSIFYLIVAVFLLYDA